jgi:primosomal protein N' (replication factor Y) (superfamily II helicase)
MSGYCEVALPVPLRTTFTYAVPDSLEDTATPGSRVVVPFRNRALLGVLLERGSERPDVANVKNISEVWDSLPALPPRLVELGRWVANYYLAPVGETFRAMLPPNVELRVARVWQITEAGRARLQALGALANRSQAEVDDLALLQLCAHQANPVSEKLIAKLPGGKAAAARLMRRGELTAGDVAERRKARMQTIVAWNPAATEKEENRGNTQSEAHEVVSTLQGRAAKARAAEARVEQVLKEDRGPLPLLHLLKLAQVSRLVVERLAQQGKVQIWEEPAAAAEPTELEADFTPPSNILNDEQRRAAEEIRGWLEAGKFTVGLLHGVTGSGKTEVYLRAVEETLARGRTALVLVPEIALTLWIGRLCRAWFGAGVAVLHSGLSDPERAAEWWRVRRGEIQVVVGTRSAVFAPLENVGIVIVDEEQESSYKQEETPRYNGRDVAIVRAKLEGAVALLGSATPSLESFHHARLGKYKLLQIGSRVENRPMAPVEIVDLRDDFRQSHHAGPVSERLRGAIAARLAEGTQSLVLINRRGYSWFALCRSCGAQTLCENCSIALTYHKRRDRLVCHYCGYSKLVPKVCPKCDSKHIYFVGAGAEQVEERLRALFPDARIARLDRDTIRSKRAFEQILGAFAAGRVDILVGTQMVAKGHDFQRVTLVGVASADAQLGFPDFRAAERTFQLLTQVAGRAGRGGLAGEVLVETFYPEHYAIQMAARQDYAAFFEKELEFRRMLHYPPFVSLASMLVRDAKLDQAIKWSRELGAFFEPMESRGIKVLGPAAAPLARLKREYRFQFLFKSRERRTLNRVLAEGLAFCVKKEIPERAILLDVDPVSLL